MLPKVKATNFTFGNCTETTAFKILPLLRPDWPESRLKEELLPQTQGKNMDSKDNECHSNKKYNVLFFFKG